MYCLPFSPIHINSAIKLTIYICLEKLLDRHIIEHLSGGDMVRTYRFYDAFIQAQRETLSAPDLLVNFEKHALEIEKRQAVKYNFTC